MKQLTVVLMTAGLSAVVSACASDWEEGDPGDEDWDEAALAEEDLEVHAELRAGEGDQGKSQLVIKGTKIRVYQESDYASIDIGTPGPENWVEVCDMEQDGNGVYAIFANPGGWKTVRDTNGSAGGCGNAYVNKATDSFKVCEDDWGPDSCSSWVDIL